MKQKIVNALTTLNHQLRPVIEFSHRHRSIILNLLKITVSVGLLAFIFYKIDLPKLWLAVQQANGGWLAAALAMMMLGVVIRARRWKILLDAIGVTVSLGELTAIYFIGFLFNNLLPSGLGGDAMRMVELNRHSKRASDAVTSVLVDRFLGLSALQALALLALLFDWDAVPAVVAYFTVAIFSGGLVMGFLLINRPLYQTLQKHLGLFRRLTGIKMVGNLFESFQRYTLPALARSYLVALLFNVSLIAMNVFIGLALGARATLAQYAVFVPIASLVLLLPISVGGLGVREETYRQLFSQVGVPAEIAVAMSLTVYFLGNVCTGLIGGIIYLLRGARGVVSATTESGPTEIIDYRE
ncbi:MAG: flippase-like domain-containing protein [Anaerolineae bacterium]|nr:flippase-like domain-containing protein [Anaerolineae bacterium]